jgi:dTDP-glucose pyrophosphorylase
VKFNFQSILVNKNISVKEAMKILQESSKKILCVIDKKKNLLGVVNDGDIRRSLLNNNSLDLKICHVMHKKPITIDYKTPDNLIKKIMIKKKIDAIPVLKNKKILNILFFDEIFEVESEKTHIVINAGGIGQRLAPLTLKKHKTLLKINNKSILSYIIENFINQGFKDFKLILRYKSDQILKYLKKKKLNLYFDYIKEKKPLGTCGGVALISKKSISQNFILINCDIISGIDFNSLLSFHKNSHADLTVVTSRKKIKLKYGSIENEGFDMLSLEEKPEINFMVNAGIYVLNKNCLKYIKINKKFDIPDLLKILQKKKKKIKIYPTNEYWFDIGSKEELNEFKKFNLNNKNLF